MVKCHPRVVGCLLSLAGAIVGFVIAKVWSSSLPWINEFGCLIVSGGLGGLAQGLATNGGRLRLPGLTSGSPLDEGGGNDSLQVGFLADVLIGSLGAVASLIFALALLSEKFFGAMQGQVSDQSVPQWVRIVAFGALAGFASRQLLPALSGRLAKLVSDEIRDQVAKVELRTDQKLEKAQARVEVAALQATGAAQRVHAPTAAGADGGSWIDQVRSLINSYHAIRIGDYNERVAARMDVAARIAAILTQHQIISQVLADHVAQESDPAWLLALATVIGIEPAVGDAGRLLDAYERILPNATIRNNSKFILYRVLLAIVALQGANRLSAADRKRSAQVAKDCLAIPDSKLNKRAEAVLALVGGR